MRNSPLQIYRKYIANITQINRKNITNENKQSKKNKKHFTLLDKAYKGTVVNREFKVLMRVSSFIQAVAELAS